MIEVKDQSIVKLTNQLHEVELAAKIDQVNDPLYICRFVWIEKLCALLQMTNQLHEVELAAKIDQVDGVHGVPVEICVDCKMV